VAWIGAEWVAIAEVGNGQDDAALEEPSALLVDFEAAAGSVVLGEVDSGWIGAGFVKAAFPGAFAAVHCASYADIEGEGFPIAGIEGALHGHG
jgi:hypothetical protein